MLFAAARNKHLQHKWQVIKNNPKLKLSRNCKTKIACNVTAWHALSAVTTDVWIYRWLLTMLLLWLSV